MHVPAVPTSVLHNLLALGQKTSPALRSRLTTRVNAKEWQCSQSNSQPISTRSFKKLLQKRIPRAGYFGRKKQFHCSTCISFSVGLDLGHASSQPLPTGCHLEQDELAADRRLVEAVHQGGQFGQRDAAVELEQGLQVGQVPLLVDQAQEAAPLQPVRFLQAQPWFAIDSRDPVTRVMVGWVVRVVGGLGCEAQMSFTAGATLFCNQQWGPCDKLVLAQMSIAA